MPGLTTFLLGTALAGSGESPNLVSESDGFSNDTVEGNAGLMSPEGAGDNFKGDDQSPVPAFKGPVQKLFSPDSLALPAALDVRGSDFHGFTTPVDPDVPTQPPSEVPVQESGLSFLTWVALKRRHEAKTKLNIFEEPEKYLQEIFNRKFEPSIGNLPQENKNNEVDFEKQKVSDAFDFLTLMYKKTGDDKYRFLFLCLMVSIEARIDSLEEAQENDSENSHQYQEALGRYISLCGFAYDLNKSWKPPLLKRFFLATGLDLPEEKDKGFISRIPRYGWWDVQTGSCLQPEELKKWPEVKYGDEIGCSPAFLYHYKLGSAGTDPLQENPDVHVAMGRRVLAFLAASQRRSGAEGNPYGGILDVVDFLVGAGFSSADSEPLLVSRPNCCSRTVFYRELAWYQLRQQKKTTTRWKSQDGSKKRTEPCLVFEVDRYSPDDTRWIGEGKIAVQQFGYVQYPYLDYISVLPDDDLGKEMKKWTSREFFGEVMRTLLGSSTKDETKSAIREAIQKPEYAQIVREQPYLQILKLWVEGKFFEACVELGKQDFAVGFFVAMAKVALDDCDGNVHIERAEGLFTLLPSSHLAFLRLSLILDQLQTQVDKFLKSTAATRREPSPPIAIFWYDKLTHFLLDPQYRRFIENTYNQRRELPEIPGSGFSNFAMPSVTLISEIQDLMMNFGPTVEREVNGRMDRSRDRVRVLAGLLPHIPRRPFPNRFFAELDQAVKKWISEKVQLTLESEESSQDKINSLEAALDELKKLGLNLKGLAYNIACVIVYGHIGKIAKDMVQRTTTNEEQEEWKRILAKADLNILAVFGLIHGRALTDVRETYLAEIKERVERVYGNLLSGEPESRSPNLVSIILAVFR